jgi:hypothetical protein
MDRRKKEIGWGSSGLTNRRNDGRNTPRSKYLTLTLAAAGELQPLAVNEIRTEFRGIKNADLRIFSLLVLGLAELISRKSFSKLPLPYPKVLTSRALAAGGLNGFQTHAWVCDADSWDIS